MVLLQERSLVRVTFIHSPLLVRDSFFPSKAHSSRLCSHNFKGTVESVQEKSGYKISVWFL